MAFVLLPAMVSAQDFKADMKEINLRMQQGNWRMKTSYIAHELGSKVPIQQMAGVSIRYENNYYSQLGPLENVVTSNAGAVYVNHDEKQVRYFSKPLPAKGRIGELDTYMDLMEGTYQKRDHSLLGKGWAQYVLHADESLPYSKVVIVYQLKDFALRQIQMWYRPGMGQVDTEQGVKVCSMLEINFSAQEKPVKKPIEFELNRYVQCQGKFCQSVGLYKDYTLIKSN